MERNYMAQIGGKMIYEVCNRGGVRQNRNMMRKVLRKVVLVY